MELGERDEAHRLARTALELLESTEARTSEDRRSKEILSATLILLGRIQFDQGQTQDAHASWIDAREIIESVSGFSDDLSFLELWVRALLYLDRVEDAKPAIEKMLSLGYGYPSFLELCRSKGALS